MCVYMCVSTKPKLCVPVDVGLDNHRCCQELLHVRTICPPILIRHGTTLLLNIALPPAQTTPTGNPQKRTAKTTFKLY